MAGTGYVSYENEQSVLTKIKTLFDTKAAAIHTHQQSDVTGLDTALAGKANATHTHVCTDVTDLETKLAEYAKKTEIANVYKWQGTITWAELIAKTDAEIGYVYSVTDKDGMNYGCIKANTAGEENWDALGSITKVDLSGYYTITQIQANYYTKSEIDEKISGLPVSGHTHEISDVIGLQAALDGKAAASHTHTAANITDFASQVNILIDSKVRALTEEEMETLLATLD